MLFKKLGLIIALLLGSVPALAQSPSSYIKPVMAMCMNPSGVLISVNSPSGGAPTPGYITQVALVGTDTTGGTGNHYLQCDANGNLNGGGGGGSMTWPSTPGISVCTGTPCTAWSSSLSPPASALVGISDTQTLTNKTVDGVTPTTFGYLDATSSIQTQLNGKTNSSVVPNTAPLAGQVLVGNSGGTAYAPQTLSQDATLNSSGQVTVQGLNGTNFTGYSGLLKFTSGTPSQAVAGTDYATPSQTSTPVGYSPNQTLSGCGVEYVSGLTYNVGACTYTINSQTYSSSITSESLTADTSFDRIDVIGVDITGSVFVIAGTPATNPQEPTIDPSQQLILTFVYIPANASTPSNTTLVTIFDEGTEWTPSYSAHLALSTNNPYRGTHDVEATAAVLNNYVHFLDPASGTVNLSNYNNLVFYIRSKAKWPSGASGSTAARSLAIYWVNGTTQRGQQVVLSDGQFGFSSSNTTTYQQISIPTTLFGNQGIALTSLYMVVAGPAGSSSIGFYIDAVTLQGGTGVVSLPATLTNWKGVWNSTALYNANDIVNVGDVGYVALLANTNTAVNTVGTWQSLGRGPDFSIIIPNGIVATPGAFYAPASASGIISHCYFTTTQSDSSTAFTFNIKINGTNVLSGTNATVSAGTTAQTISTFALTSSTVTVTKGQLLELDISSGTANWQGIASCY